MAEKLQRGPAEKSVVFQSTISGHQAEKVQMLRPLQFSLSKFEDMRPFFEGQTYRELLQELSTVTDEQIFHIYFGLQAHALLYYLTVEYRTYYEQQLGIPRISADYCLAPDGERLQLEKWLSANIPQDFAKDNPSLTGLAKFSVWRIAQEFQVADNPRARKRNRVLRASRAFATGLREDIWFSNELSDKLEIVFEDFVRLASKETLVELDPTRSQAVLEQKYIVRVVLENGQNAFITIIADRIFVIQGSGVWENDEKFMNQIISVEDLGPFDWQQLLLRQASAVPQVFDALKRMDKLCENRLNPKLNFQEKAVRERKLRETPTFAMDPDGLVSSASRANISNQYPHIKAENGHFFTQKLTLDQVMLEGQAVNLEYLFELLYRNDRSLYNQWRLYDEAKRLLNEGLTPQTSLNRYLLAGGDLPRQQAMFLHLHPLLRIVRPKMSKKAKASAKAKVVG